MIQLEQKNQLKDLRNLDQDLRSKAGIYRILNIKNDKQYIGSSRNIKSRWHDHRSLLRSNKHHSKHLQAAWNKYGEENFKFEVLWFLEPNREILLIEEQQCLNFLSCEYNSNKIAISTLGFKHSEESKRKMSIAKRAMSQETKSKMSRARLGKSPSNKGRSHSKETRDKISTAITGNTNRKGHHHSQDTKNKIGAASKGRKHTTENRKKISEVLSRRGCSPETKKKLSIKAKVRSIKLQRIWYLVQIFARLGAHDPNRSNIKTSKKVPRTHPSRNHSRRHNSNFNR